jgi:DNA-binding NarL/FixJ family response regulator
MQKYNIYIPTLILITASLFFAYDITVDLYRRTDSYIHIFVECAVFIGTSIALYMEIRRVIQLRYVVTLEQDKVARLSGELFDVINKDFDKWELTSTEKEIALLLIRGLSMQEIGELRRVKEKTIRQQATQIYAKSGYANRQELASHFIEDLIRTIPD